MISTLESGLDATRVAGRLTGNEPWNDSSYPIEDGFEQAAALGVDVVVAKPNELQLDIDDLGAYTRFNQMVGMFGSFFDITNITDNPSRSGVNGRRHITLTLANPISNVERVLVQAILGSDPKRELLSYIRLLRGVEPATMFFEKRDSEPVKPTSDSRLHASLNDGYGF